MKCRKDRVGYKHSHSVNACRQDTEVARPQLKDQLIHIQLDLKAEGNIQHDFQSTPE